MNFLFDTNINKKTKIKLTYVLKFIKVFPFSLLSCLSKILKRSKIYKSKQETIPHWIFPQNGCFFK